jgi:predicted O-methyltransferase YrrM
MSYSNNIAGWISEPELQWLHSTAKEMETIIEVGSWKGRSTHALLSGCPGTVWAVDHFEGNIGEEEARKEAREKDIHAEFMANVGQFPNLRLLRMANLEAAKLFEDRSVDMVFIDGGHRYEEVKADLIAWLPKAKKLICGHDYCWPSVKQAVDEVFGKPDFLCESIWIKRLRGEA